MGVRLYWLAQGTAFDILPDIGTHGGPPVIPLSKLPSVPGSRAIMGMLKDGKAGCW